MFGVSLPEAISAATINAAWALGLGSQTGSLEHGKRGDLILLNASDYRELQMLSSTNLTHSLIKRGVVLCKEDFPGWPSLT
jgi:imidazolonepropionase